MLRVGIARSIGLAACTATLVACFGIGAPLQVVFHNDSGVPITVIYRVDGVADRVLAKGIRVDADFAVNIVDFGKLDDICEIGVQIAVDPDGREVARRDGGHSGAMCRTWGIGGTPPLTSPSG